MMVQQVGTHTWSMRMEPCGVFSCWSEDEWLVGSRLGRCNALSSTLIEKSMGAKTTCPVREAGDLMSA